MCRKEIFAAAEKGWGRDAASIPGGVLEKRSFDSPKRMSFGEGPLQLGRGFTAADFQVLQHPFLVSYSLGIVGTGAFPAADFLLGIERANSLVLSARRTFS